MHIYFNPFYDSQFSPALAKGEVKLGSKTVGQAAHAYMKRQSAAQKPAQRRSVPTVKNASGAGRGSGSRIMDMSKEDFRKLRERAERAMLDGKNVSFD